MSLSVIVENGSGLSNSTTYVSVQEFRDYWTQRGIDYSSTLYADSTIGIWLNEATDYADQYYCYNGIKRIKTEATQALEVPRDSWYDKDGYSLDVTVPDGLKNAIYTLSSERKGVDSNTISETGIANKKIGPVSVSYTNGGETKTKYIKANNYMKGLLEKTSGNLCLSK